MNIYVNKSLNRVEVLPTSSVDITFLKHFPGLCYCRSTQMYWMPIKQSVVYNILSRMKKYYLKKKTGVLQISQEVVSLNSGSVKLLPLPETFHYFTSALPHQDLGLRFLYTNKGGGLLADPGLGKTKIVLDYFALTNRSASTGQAWVVCPKALLFVWEDEQAKHRPDKSIYVVKSLTWDRYIAHAQSKLTEDTPEKERVKILRKIAVLEKERDEDTLAMRAADIVVVNYDRAVAGYEVMVQQPIACLAIDEALVKDPKSLRTIRLTDIVLETKTEVILMSGTLVNNTPEDVFSPVRMMEPALVGASHFKFRQRYCDLRGSGKQKFAVGYVDTDEVKGILRTCSIILRKEEWLKDLPPKKFIREVVSMPRETVEIYEELARNFTVEVQGETVSVDSALTAHAKLSQIGSGFLYAYDDDEDFILFDEDGVRQKRKPRSIKDRKILFFPEQPKIVAMRRLLTGILSSRKLILWYRTTGEVMLIEAELKALGVKYITIKGGEKSTRNKVHDFNNDASIGILLCQEASVNYGITVLGRNPERADSLEEDCVIPDVDTQVYTHLFYSLSYSLERFLQQQDRSHRIGATREVEYWVLVADLPIEREVTLSLQNKMILREDFLEDSLAALRKRLNQR
jgi:SNF2 family DNA or RNA helicase